MKKVGNLKIKAKIDHAIKTDLSSIKSISQHENSRFEELDSVIDMDLLRMHDYYKTRDPILLFQLGLTG